MKNCLVRDDGRCNTVDKDCPGWCELAQKRNCKVCGCDKQVAEVATKLGHRPDVAFAKLAKAIDRLAKMTDALTQISEMPVNCIEDALEMRNIAWKALL